LKHHIVVPTPPLRVQSSTKYGHHDTRLIMKRILLWLAPLALLGVLVGLYFRPESPQPESKPEAQPAPPAEPAIRHPIQPVDILEEPLPPLAESDGPLRDALQKMLGRELPEFIYLDRMIHRIVATVDNLPRDYAAPKLMPLKPVSGSPMIERSGEELMLSSKNADRYSFYVRFAEAVPTNAAVAVYARFYPLFQEQYETLGYPDKYFNDRVIEVIDHLLAAPQIDGPVRLVQPRVLYEYADPNLENLSAGQKILVRIGRANALTIKAKLREIRAALAPPAGSVAHSSEPKS
jgi:hypothetical protein